MDILKKKDNIERFWSWFKRREKYIFNHIVKKADDIAIEIQKHLKEIDINLEFEISFELVKDKRNFVISADGDITLFDLVIDLTNKAPSFERWNIIPFRPRLNQKNQVIEMDGVSLDYDDIYFTYLEDEIHDMIHLNVYVNGYDGEDNRFVHIYFLLLDSLIGEYDAVTKIGETVMYPINPELEIPLHEFRDIIEIIDSLDKTTKVN